MLLSRGLIRTKTWRDAVLRVSLILQYNRIQGSGCHQTGLTAQLASERGCTESIHLKLLRHW